MLTSPGFSLTCITEFHTRIRAVLQASGRTDVRWRLCPTGNRTLVELGLRPDSGRSPKMCLQAPPEGRRRRRPSAHQPAKPQANLCSRRFPIIIGAQWSLMTANYALANRDLPKHEVEAFEPDNKWSQQQPDSTKGQSLCATS